MLKDIALLIDSTYKYSDAWKMYFGEFVRYFPSKIEKYLFTDYCDLNNIDNLRVVYYKNEDSYRNQMLGCLKEITHKYIIYTSEDYILYDTVKIDEILRSMMVLDQDDSYNFVKFIRGPENVTPHPIYENLHIINKNDKNFFAQQASLWKTSSFIKIFENSNPQNGRMEQEPGGSEICRRLNIGGLQYFNGKEKKRGIYHYDSDIYPSIATAIVKGKWNTGEYNRELLPLFGKYNIDKNIRTEI